MVISKLPKKQEEFIQGKKKEKLNHLHNVLVRIPDDMLERMESKIKERSVKISRNKWILEAISNYLE